MYCARYTSAVGQSTDGILFYGIDFGEDGLDLDEYFDKQNEDHDFEEHYARKVAGIHLPDEPWSAESPAWEKDRKARQKAETACPCKVASYCSGDYPIYFASVKDGFYRVNRGDAIEIPDGLTARPEWKDQLRTYCEQMALPYSEPKWWLVSNWN